MGQFHDRSFPGETPAYRTARDELLAAEIELRAAQERVASLRRSLPTGGVVAGDYVFHGPEGPVPFADLFGDHDTLVLYSFMYGPGSRACPMCSSMLDALDGNVDKITDNVALHVVAKSPLARILGYARERGWRNLPLLSSEGTTYNADYHGETSEGNQLPSLNVFVRGDDGIRHFYNTELLFAPMAEGQDSRHVDGLWPLWSLLDFTPDGRGNYYP